MQIANESPTASVPRRCRPDAPSFLAALSRIYRSQAQPVANLDALADLAVPGFADVCVIDVFAEDEPDIRIAVAAGRREDSVALQALRCESRSLLPVLIRDAASAGPHELGTSAAEAELFQDLGVSSLIRVPLLSHGNRLGLVTFARAKRAEPYDDEDVAEARVAATMAAMDVQLSREEKRCVEAIASRDEAIAMAAHEIKTPLTLLHMLIDRVQRLVPDDATVRSLARMKGAVRHVEQVAASILDASYFEHGCLQLRRTPVEVGTLLAQVVSAIQQAHGDSGCLIRLHGSWPIEGHVDAVKLDQLFTNLISNAVKYGNGKPVDVTAEQKGGLLYLRVQDQGIGISEDALGRLFQPFQRAVGRNYRGLGLGLYICRRIVEAHDGTIQVSSAAGAGTTITVELPLE